MLTELQRYDIAVFLLENSEDGKLKYVIVNEAAAKWDVHRHSIQKIWLRAKTQRLLGVTLNVKSHKYENTNKKRILPDINFIKGIPFKERSTIYKLAKKLRTSVGTVHSWTVQGLLKPHSSPLHPTLSDTNKVDRLKFALTSLRIEQSQPQPQPQLPIPTASITIKFKNRPHIIHMDEKWYFISRQNQRYYIVDGEDLPHRTCQSKRFITKVMFMGAVCKPMFTEEGDLFFDGKIGMFPFTSKQPAKRTSKNRAAGTLETKAMESINKQVTKDMLINMVIPAIKSKWLATASKHILIQQDNAPSHINDNDPEFRMAASSDGFDIHLFFQPPNSPDLNTNDLGFFRAIQSLQADISAKNVDELVQAVDQAFRDYSPTKLNYIFLTLQSVKIEIMKKKGNNNFTIPHMKKAQLERLGQLPLDLSVDEILVRECVEYLIEIGNTIGLENLMLELGYL